MPEDYRNNLLPVDTLFSHSLTAVNLECGWLPFERVTTFQGHSTKIACDYRPCFKVNIRVLSCRCAPHLFSTVQSQTPTASPEKQIIFCTCINVRLQHNAGSQLHRCGFAELGVFTCCFTAFSFKSNDDGESQQALNGHSSALSVCLLSWSLSQLITQLT